ncbi:MAG: putative methyltransferase [Firmicutes bacterium ADurb.Bin456]|nr:MAG: putative methyltransferase [Firmicutes bacterium ADurb.Bin456]
MTCTHREMEEYKDSFAVTTSHRPTRASLDLGRQFAGYLQVPFVERNDLSLKDLALKQKVKGLVVAGARRVSYFAGGQEFFFHPGLAGLRIKELQNGKTDQMIKCMLLCPGAHVLDCTLGLAADSIVASYVAGKKGRVTGLEDSRVIAALVKHGLATYPAPEEDLAGAMRRIVVININHKEYLSGLAPQSFDIVYFDPMFRLPRRHSPAMDTLRLLANPHPLDRETIDLALRASAQRIVMKERRGSPEFKRLGFDRIDGGKYAPVVYGIMERKRLVR